jgi:hypothetical protein
MTVQLGYHWTGTCTISAANILTVNVSNAPPAGGSGVFSGNDVGNLINVNGSLVRVASYISTTQVTLGGTVLNGGPGIVNGSGQTFDLWRPAPVDTVSGIQGQDDADAQAQGYWGRRFTDGPEPSPIGPTLAQFMGQPEWSIPPANLPNGTANPNRTFNIWVFAVSRLADNELGGSETVTLQAGWPGGADHGVLNPTLQTAALDLSQISTANSLNDTSLSGGAGSKVKVNLGYTMFLNASGQVAVNNLPSLSSLPTLPSSSYPAGSVVRLSTDGYLYRTDGLTWTQSTNPADLAAGAIASGVTLNASQVNAGTFNGCQLILNLNGVTTSISNQFIGGTTNKYTGYLCTDNTSGAWTGIPAGSIILENGPLGSATASALLTGGGTGLGGLVNVSGVSGVNNSYFQAYANGSTCQLQMQAINGSTAWLIITGNSAGISIVIYGLPSSNPGTGSKALWYDPTDSNRVKYTP